VIHQDSPVRGHETEEETQTEGRLHIETLGEADSYSEVMEGTVETNPICPKRAQQQRSLVGGPTTGERNWSGNST
jgi:hypothetical protein